MYKSFTKNAVREKYIKNPKMCICADKYTEKN